jgi:hypothetical protein
VTLGIIAILLGSSSAAAAGATSSRDVSSPITNSGRCPYAPYVYVCVNHGGEYNSNFLSWNMEIRGTEVNGHGVPRYGWAFSPYRVYCASGCTMRVKISSNVALVGNYYSFWETSHIYLTKGWDFIGNTPQVTTGYALVAPSYDRFWTGSGTTSSSGTFVVTIPAGVYEYFEIHDDLWTQMAGKLDSPCHMEAEHMLLDGCSVPGVFVSGFPGWYPLGIDTSWSYVE